MRDDTGEGGSLVEVQGSPATGAEVDTWVSGSFCVLVQPDGLKHTPSQASCQLDAIHSSLFPTYTWTDTHEAPQVQHSRNGIRALLTPMSPCTHRCTPSFLIIVRGHPPQLLKSKD